MKLNWVRLLCLLILLSGLYTTASNFLDLETWAPPSRTDYSISSVDRSPSRRSLLSSPSEGDTALVAALDGTVHLVEPKSGKTFWSFASGSSIYSSYQASNHDYDSEQASQMDSFHIECGDEWDLYVHSAFGKWKLPMNIEEFISTLPYVAEDGGIILGSKQTSVFLIDAKTGKVIYNYRLNETPAAGEETLPVKSMVKPGELPLYITRTDYTIKSFYRNSDKVVWNMTVAEIGAAFLCEENAENLVAEPGLRFNMPLPCQSKAIVYRFRNHNMLGPSFNPHMLRDDARDEEDLTTLPMPSSFDMHNSPPKVARFLERYSDNTIFPLSGSVGEYRGVRLPRKSRFIVLSEKFKKISLFSFVTILVVLVIYNYISENEKEPVKQEINHNSGIVTSRRKKIRKPGRNISLIEKNEIDFPGRKPWFNYDQQDGHGRMIGKLFVSNREIAKGSNGTIVLEGLYEGRVVAVKRLVRAHHDVAFKEIQNLIASDRHPSIIRWHGVEYDQDFVYLSLERCNCSLSDLIAACCNSEKQPANSTESISDHNDALLPSANTISQDIKFWKPNGHPSPILLKLMRDVVAGLVHLHDVGIIHRDLKPQNVLILKERILCAKLSDMGISKSLVGDKSSLGHQATGSGSSGWQAPEQLLHERQTRAVDMFSLGSVLFFCITGGKHPFGDHLERDINVVKNKPDLFLVEYIPEAADLLSRLLNPKADLRPKAIEAYLHPFFWSSEMRLSFLHDASDRVELENRETESALLKALESRASVALGSKWDEKMEPEFLNNIGRYRRYKFNSVRDLLRVIRNKLNHYRELPTQIQELLGPVPEGFDSYFATRFPKLVIEVYNVFYAYCREEECFHKYFKMQ
ncbi:serine/threonine-protein kinase/endoribonuclease IRE1a [Impatiens glandulifera]|uniref:serine/threonine-protein kinase/endoribonuclease IRE1a n=1 Tax=Impatiens glandulifera TaxID=253017 RepID=UPI001FB1621D|nr:serine/threonine-protein kinase/endoribonuclease IRE1a [Impatiens glandulifera]